MLARFQNHNNVPTARCETRGGRAWTQCWWAAAGPGRASRSTTPSRRLTARTASRRAATHQHTQRPERASAALQAPPVWRMPVGPEGQGGPRDRPLRAAGSRVAISRAAGPDGARNTCGTTSNKNPGTSMGSGASGGGWGIRTPEGLHPTRFPSVRHRPLGESSVHIVPDNYKQ